MDNNTSNPNEEKFSVVKALKGVDLLDAKLWSKSFAIGIRVALVVGLAAFGYGYWKGHQKTPVTVSLDNSTIVLKDQNGTTHTLIIQDHQLKFDGKTVNTEDVKNLRPFGIEIHPKAVAGITSAGHPAAGLAVEVAHAYNLNLDILAMVPFVGAGISYDLHINGPIHIDNSSIGLGYGRDLESNTNEAIVYYSVKF